MIVPIVKHKCTEITFAGDCCTDGALSRDSLLFGPILSIPTPYPESSFWKNIRYSHGYTNSMCLRWLVEFSVTMVETDVF